MVSDKKEFNERYNDFRVLNVKNMKEGKIKRFSEKLLNRSLERSKKYVDKYLKEVGEYKIQDAVKRYGSSERYWRWVGKKYV